MKILPHNIKKKNCTFWGIKSTFYQEEARKLPVSGREKKFSKGEHEKGMIVELVFPQNYTGFMV